jgi:hypothetical protein
MIEGTTNAGWMKRHDSDGPALRVDLQLFQ